MTNITEIINKKDLEKFSQEEIKKLSKVILETSKVSLKSRQIDVYLLSQHVLSEQILSKLKDIISSYLPGNTRISIQCENLDGEDKGQGLIKKA